MPLVTLMLTSPQSKNVSDFSIGRFSHQSQSRSDPSVATGPAVPGEPDDETAVRRKRRHSETDKTQAAESKACQQRSCVGVTDTSTGQLVSVVLVSEVVTFGCSLTYTLL